MFNSGQFSLANTKMFRGLIFSRYTVVLKNMHGKLQSVQTYQEGRAPPPPPPRLRTVSAKCHTVLKVVHAIAYRIHYRSWMTRVALVIPWISGICTDLLPAIATTRLVRGRCLKFAAWSNTTLKQVRTDPIWTVLGHITIYVWVILSFWRSLCNVLMSLFLK